MKILVALMLAAAVCATGVRAQSSQQTTKSKVTIKHGTAVELTGCVERSATETGFILTRVADKHGARPDYMLVADDDEHLAKHVGHRVEIKGTATDRGDAKIEMKSSTKTSGGGDHETHVKTDVEGNLPHLPYLGVRSVKLIAAACR